MNKDAEIIGIWGGRGSGKTTRQIELMAGRDRVIVLDPMGSFKAKGFKTVNSLKSLYMQIKKGWNSGFKLVLRTQPNETACISIMKQLARGLFAVQKPYFIGKDRRKITLVLDEAHKFFPNRRLVPEEQEPLEDIIALGRHYGIEMIAASQRLAKVWTEYRDNCSQHYFFRQGDHTGLNAVLSSIGNDHKDELRDLRDHEYLHKGKGMTITRGRNKAKF